jgi:hypothetical protein
VLARADEAYAKSDARLLVNERSGRAALQVPARSVMLDDGSIEARIRLIRPLDALPMAAAHLAETQWREASRAEFSAAWSKELAELPEFTESTIHMVTGLLLPVWTRLPNETAKVYRLQTTGEDGRAGERLIGRKVPASWAAAQKTGERPTLLPAEAHALLVEGRTVLALAGGMQLKPSRVMHALRIELTGFTDHERERLKADGLFSEIISWTLRLFVPVDAFGVAVLARVLARHPVERILAKETAS